MRREVLPPKAAIFQDFKCVQAFLERKRAWNHALKDGVRSAWTANRNTVLWASETRRLNNLVRH
jgi:hypothetical protein